MIFSKLDLFSSPFSFNTGNQQMKRGTLFGTITTFGVLIATLSYFIYIIQQYATNQIDPVFRSQSLINRTLIETPLSSDLVGFRFEMDNSSKQQISQDKTYFVYLAFFEYISSDLNLFIPLNVIDCTNSNLQGFKCLDFTSVQNYTLLLNTNQNRKSTIQIMTYGCLDIDKLKTYVPDNCASQAEIDKMVNGINSLLRLKLYTSQYNTVTQRREINYRNAYVYTVANQQIVTQLKTQNQNTSIKQGLIVQSESTFFSPIQYSQSDQNIDRQYALQQIGAGGYTLVILMLDEIIQHIQIQYPTLPQILALVSGIFTLLMLIGTFGRMVSQNSINKDFFILFLKYIYQDNYLQILKANNYFFNNENQEIVINQDQFIIEDQTPKRNLQEINNEKQQQNQQKISLPLFYSKQKTAIELEQFNNTNQENIENLLFLQSNTKTSNNSIPQDFNEESIFNQNSQNKQNSKNIEFQEPKSMIQVSQINQQNDLQKLNLPLSVTLNATLKQSATNKIKEKNIFLSKDKNALDGGEEHVKLMKNLKAIQDSNSFSKIQQNLNKIKKQMQASKEYQVQKVDYQIRKDLNIFNFIKDIILIKKAIMMLLTKDQLAALHLVGCSSSFLELNLSSINCNINQYVQSKNLSYYEIQTAILQSEKFQNDFVQEFLSRCSSESNLSKIDQRIISSIKKCHQL
ncbi:AMP-binding enzyme family protein (macronuclear) [Tetrahymena thermophila SB210]|uniref:AMP-binding enzyme family protein n=1 Tax=Tetrahymena thermophila (strain SB210) TaxID=312017 RepID=I7LZK7_TETTS|nr:AMP-binding enzyme family protein [Tetrahymena thermophila SB210]EAR84115.3 AMP-binding enzyme family protein [Tetrahymena thermophila SB210]|eukprot:XP_001031778.3 AMP-binding enzyme family protein [Tetrahymena thermophila SB210]